jgi:hypothetical protein
MLFSDDLRISLIPTVLLIILSLHSLLLILQVIVFLLQLCISLFSLFPDEVVFNSGVDVDNKSQADVHNHNRTEDIETKEIKIDPQGLVIRYGVHNDKQLPIVLYHHTEEHHKAGSEVVEIDQSILSRDLIVYLYYVFYRFWVDDASKEPFS